MDVGIIAIVAGVFHLLGFVSAIRAVMETRTSQGAVAWALGLVTFPYVAVPAYWILGRKKFQGFVALRRADLLQAEPTAREYLSKLVQRGLIPWPGREAPLTVERLAKLPFTTGNDVELLIDGEATFRSIFEGIDRAQDYVLVQFYILRADGLGQELQQRLIGRASDGVRCYLLYDEVGSHGLPRDYIATLEAAGVKVSCFNTRKGRANRFQVNFRNHRKIVVVDGQEAWVGGHNVGDEYLGRDPKIGHWRDTHVRVLGPAAQTLQVSFLEDWHWATDRFLDLDWEPLPAPSGRSVAALALPSGPADELETCTLFFIGAIQRATQRLWIASPYFVPDEQFITALQLAALRGVDVRIIVPAKTDNLLVNLSQWSYLEELESVGIRVYRHEKGFMHQKVLLVDDDCATVGTANFDNRSFRLNFEVTLVVADRQFNEAVARMLEADLADSRLTTSADLLAKPCWFRFAVRLARLTAPIQ